MTAGSNRWDNSCSDSFPLLGPPLMRSDGERRPVVCSPKNLRLHEALGNPDFIDVVEELNEAARLKDLSAAEPINGTILAGFGHWRSALLEGSHKVHCIELPICEEESLRFILNHHKPRPGWNAFVRIRAALTQERDLQQRALDNMRAGGKYKGLANLPEAQHINVRQQIADDAGVGTRNVSSAKTILKKAHPRLILALLNGTLSINRAMQFCKLPAGEQLEAFIRQAEDRAIQRVIRGSVDRPKTEETIVEVATATILYALQQQESRKAGSVLVRLSRLQRTVLLLGKDLLADPSLKRS